MSDSLGPRGLQHVKLPRTLLSPWSLLRFMPRVFRIQGLNPCLLCLLHWQAGSLPLAPLGKPWQTEVTTNQFPFFFLQITAISPLEDRIVRTWPHHSESSFSMDLISDEMTNSLINLPTYWRGCVQTRKYRPLTAGSIPLTNMAESWNLKLS